jgi:hypothetical protein
VAAVRASAAIAYIGFLVAAQRIIAIPTQNDVIVFLALERVISTPTDDAVIPIAPAEVVISGGG